MNSFTSRAANLARSRAKYFIYIFCALIFCVAGLITQIMLDSAYTDQVNEAERRLGEQVQSRASQMSLAMASLKNQVRYLANTDLLRLYTFEVYNLDEEKIQKKEEIAPKSAENPEQNPEQSLEQNPEEGAEAAPVADIIDLRQQTPIMHKLLAKFARESTILQVSLLTVEKKIYISSEVQPPSLSRTQTVSAENALKYGVMQVQPAYIDESGRLVLDILFPVYPPLYVAGKDSKPVGVLLVSSDLSEKLQDLPAPDPITGEHWRLLQSKDKGLQEISPQKPPMLKPFAKWLSETNTIPFSLRKLLDGSKVYSVAVNIADTPLYLSFELFQEYAEENYAQYKKNLLILMLVCVACVFLLVGMAWWWLLGQREKAVSGELQSLYKKVNAQKQLLDKVNSAVPDGIVLKDLTGKIGYVNDAFARMVKRPAAELIGEFHESLIAPLTTMHSLHLKSNEVLKTGTTSVYNESLLINEEKRLFQVITLPLFEEGTAMSDLVIVYRDITDIEKAHEKSQHLTRQMVSVLVRSLETVDPYLSGQSMFTADLANRLALMLNLEFSHTTTVRAAGSLSQLGMLQLPFSLRTKEGALSAEELATVHKHVEYTQEMLKDIDFGVPVQEAVYQMWEGMDGSGYPKGLKGEEISIDARVLSVANTFCALMRPRAYRQAHNVQHSLEILAGPKFDSNIVATLRAFLLSPDGQDFIKRFAQV